MLKSIVANYLSAMSVLIGIAARKSIETGGPINIQDLTSIKLTEKGREN